MKKLKLILAVSAIAFSIAACGGNKSENQSGDTVDTSLTDTNYTDSNQADTTADSTTNAPADAAH